MFLPIPAIAITYLRRHLMAYARRHPASRLIGGKDDTYLARWYLIPHNPVCNVYLHHFRRSDDDRALHDHPWPWCSILLKGTYIEATQGPGGHDDLLFRRRFSGGARLRLPTTAHRVVLDGERACWTLFLTGPRVRHWGFLCRKGWVPWEVFTDPATNGDTVGRGCGEP
ncbi:MAG TPA: hypothetical protein VFQ88_07250 [Nevskiaceae bacterium]|nr:hypothetical protein [Nevskiaceae bacterium]